MKQRFVHVLALTVGLAGALLLTWLWHGDQLAKRRTATQPRPAAISGAGSASADAATTVAALDLETRALLAGLEKVLASSDVRERESLLTFKDEAAMQRFLQRAAKGGLTVVGQLPGLLTARVRHDSFNSLQNELIDNAGDFSAVAANYLVNIPTVPAKDDRAAVDQVPFGNLALSFLGADSVPRETRERWGNGVTIAILDTGVGSDATFGAGRLNALDIGLGLAPGSASADGHGTGVAALAAGHAPDAPGVAPAANLLSIRVTDNTGVSDMFTLAQAIVAATDAGARIINVSLGGYATAPALDAALTYAIGQGSVVVAAAGNDQAAQLAWPAADPRVVSVGAVDLAEQQVTFSNAGAQLKLSAPGYGVQTAWLDGQRVYVDGTSASAPLVAGAIAAVMSQNPGLTSQQAAQMLMRTASDAGAPGTDPAFGNGILNLGWAMNLNTPGYVDTAVSSHYYDEPNHELDVVVQNRSPQVVAGLTLKVSGAVTMSYAVPTLAPGQTWVARPPADEIALTTAGSLSYTTQLVNPPDVVDANPTNNKKSSVLTAPGKP